MKNKKTLCKHTPVAIIATVCSVLLLLSIIFLILKLKIQVSEIEIHFGNNNLNSFSEKSLIVHYNHGIFSKFIPIFAIIDDESDNFLIRLDRGFHKQSTTTESSALNIAFWPINTGIQIVFLYLLSPIEWFKYKLGLIDLSSCQKVKLIANSTFLETDPESGAVIAGDVIHPTKIAINAISAFNRFRYIHKRKEGLVLGTQPIEDLIVAKPVFLQSESYKQFLDQVNWLNNNCVIDQSRSDNACWWNFPFDYMRYGLKSPWVSGMTQGLGIQALIYAYLITGDNKYLSTANKAFQSFGIPTSSGGFTLFNEDDVWFEEYPSEPPSYILNGFLFSLFALNDYYKVTGNLDAKDWFEVGKKTALKRIQDFSLGNGSKYELIKRTQRLRFISKGVTRKLKFKRIRLISNSKLGDATEISSSAIRAGNFEDQASCTHFEKHQYSTCHFSDSNFSSYFSIRSPKNSTFPGTYSLQVEMLDDFLGNIEFQIYNGRNMQRLGFFVGKKTDKWKTHSFDFNHKFLMGTEAHVEYHNLHSEQLYAMYSITGEDLL